MARDAAVPISGVVENMSGLVCGSCGGKTPLFGEGGGAELAENLEVPLLGQIPLDIALRRSGDRGVPLVVADPTAPSARAIDEVARTLRPARRPLLGRSLPLTPV